MDNVVSNLQSPLWWIMTLIFGIITSFMSNLISKRFEKWNSQRNESAKRRFQEKMEEQNRQVERLVKNPILLEGLRINMLMWQFMGISSLIVFAVLALYSGKSLEAQSTFFINIKKAADVVFTVVLMVVYTLSQSMYRKDLRIHRAAIQQMVNRKEDDSNSTTDDEKDTSS